MSPTAKAIIYVADTDVLNDDSLFDSIYRHVSKYRQEKCDRMRFRKDKNLSLAAEYLLRSSLKEFGIDYDGIGIHVDEYGKPSIEGSDIRFNLSHSGTKAMCIVSHADVGCDVERIRPIDMDIAKRFFSKEEYDYLIGHDDREETFYRLWTLKESFIKCIGLGLKMPLNEFTIRLSDDVKVMQDINDMSYSFFEGKEEGYRLAACIAKGTDYEWIFENKRIAAIG